LHHLTHEKERRKFELRIRIERELMDGILAYSRDVHPKEIILLLRGKAGNDIEVNEVVVPPGVIQGLGFSGFQPHMLPFDLSIVGVVHSHPSGSSSLSIHDLNHPYGKITMIVAYPYRSVDNITVFGKRGQILPLEVIAQ
jgi:proteasome lid subunit RPN8/RPN11